MPVLSNLCLRKIVLQTILFVKGFFGHLKTKMLYGYKWEECSIEEFVQEVDDYMHWYCRDRIKLTLGGLSLLDYRRSIGVAV